MIKKTLVALAAVAVTGGAFAQANLTGAIGYGYATNTDVDGDTTSGMGVADAQVNFGISEDLGGGTSLSGTMGFFGYGNGVAGTVGSNDMKLGLKTASGLSLNFASTKASHYLGSGIAGAGAAFELGLDGYVLSSRSRADTVSVSMPVMDGVTASVSHSEPAVSTYGTGAAGLTTQRYNTVVLGYKAGALAADVHYRSYDLQTPDTTTSASQKSRASVSYDLGVMKIGAGVDSTNYTAGNVYSESLVGITVPLGQVTLGAQFGQMSTTGYTTNYNETGALFGASYTLSKRTYLTAQYYSFTGGFASGASTAGTQSGSGATFTIYNTF